MGTAQLELELTVEGDGRATCCLCGKPRPPQGEALHWITIMAAPKRSVCDECRLDNGHTE